MSGEVVHVDWWPAEPGKAPCLRIKGFVNERWLEAITEVILELRQHHPGQEIDRIVVPVGVLPIQYQEVDGRGQMPPPPFAVIETLKMPAGECWAFLKQGS